VEDWTIPVLEALLVECACWQRRVYVLLIDGLHKLAYHQRHTLDALDLLLCPYKLPLEVPVSRVNSVSLSRRRRWNKPLLILDVLLL
jgi:hypothetical protein